MSNAKFEGEPIVARYASGSVVNRYCKVATKLVTSERSIEIQDLTSTINY
jgi:hypothetical protein